MDSKQPSTIIVAISTKYSYFCCRLAAAIREEEMTTHTELNLSMLSSIQSGDEQSSDDEGKTVNTTLEETSSSATDDADADIDTTLASPRYSRTIDNPHIQTVYNELALIRSRLSQEHERLKKKAQALNQWEERMRETIERGWQAHKEKFDCELNNSREKLTTITRDFKRTNDALQVLREQNGELKRTTIELRETNEKLIEKVKQTEKRAENLVRLNAIAEQKSKNC